MELGWPQEFADFREEVRSFIKDNLPPEWWSKVPGEEPYSDITLNFCRKLGEKGWLMPHWPVEYGGSGDESPWRYAILNEELWSHGEPRGSQYMNSNYIGPAIMRYGTKDQKQRYLPPITAGEALWCQGFSEREAGTDLASMKTSAVRDGDDYVINGEKIWTSYARGAHQCMLLARTDAATTDASGISIFLVATNTPGYTIVPVNGVLDIHTTHVMTFQNARVPAVNRLGPENGGWDIIREALADERIGSPRHIRANVILETAIEAARKAGRLTPALLREAAHARSVCRAAKIFSYQVRQTRALTGDAGTGAYLAKCVTVSAERAVADVVANMAGPEGLESGSIADGEFRTALIAGLGGGSYEVQLNLIARLWLKLPKAA
jgi:alkylation response protein AidB-like acyl-CoA dehydrogenase